MVFSTSLFWGQPLPWKQTGAEEERTQTLSWDWASTPHSWGGRVMLAACSPRKSSEPSRGPSGEEAPCSLLHPLSTESVPRSYGRREEVMVPPVPHTSLFLPSFRRFSWTKISLFTVCPGWLYHGGGGAFYNFYQLRFFPGKPIHRAPQGTIPDRSLKAYFYPTGLCQFLLLILIKINLNMFVILKNKQFWIVYHVISGAPACCCPPPSSGLMPLFHLHTGQS